MGQCFFGLVFCVFVVYKEFMFLGIVGERESGFIQNRFEFSLNFRVKYS